MNKTQIRLKKLFELYGPSLATEFNIPVGTLHQIIKAQNKTIPIKILDKIDDIVERDRQLPGHTNPSIFLPENSDKGLVYAAMSKVQGQYNKETYVWHLYAKKPSYVVSESLWKPDGVQIKIEFHTIPRDLRGYGSALFERTSEGWKRCMVDDVKIEGTSTQDRWDKKNP